MCIAVAFDKTGQVGYAGAASNGVGAEVIKSEDAGKTWKAVFPRKPANGTKPTPVLNLFLAAATASKTQAVVSGAFFDAWTIDGADFVPSLNGELSPSQDADIMPNGEFGLVTQRKDGVSSVATSATGLIWKHHDLGTKESPILNKF